MKMKKAILVLISILLCTSVYAEDIIDEAQIVELFLMGLLIFTIGLVLYGIFMALKTTFWSDNDDFIENVRESYQYPRFSRRSSMIERVKSEPVKIDNEDYYY